MFSSLLVLSLAALAPLAHANVFITNPTASTSIPAGSAYSITWEDDGKTPNITAFGPSSIGLYAGSQSQQTLLQLIASNVDVSKVNSQSWTPDATVGPNYNAYFIRFTSNSLPDTTQAGANAEAFSAKFTLTGMTGQFNSTVQAEISGSVSASSAAATSAASSASKPLTTATVASSAGSAVKASATATGTGSSSKNNGAGHMAIPGVLGATGVAAIVFTFFL